MASSHFKQCPCCHERWRCREEFLADPSIELEGYKVDFTDLEQGLFLFTHRQEGCGSTIAIEVCDFKALYPHTIYQERKTGDPDCPCYCLHKDLLARCENQCQCAFVREVIHIIRHTPKRKRAVVEHS
ncbi:hypothetical protein [Dongshaea marina]|uniref:hypothetical protein n=1 Tax=Dongshaea marina TaxID=2047966 RepID=UPI000D3E2EF9|nr:hypothetical protein [Dongshaea marina]